jgi:16S rRNA (uracil1498-N3)-methyltransferase
MRLHRFYIDTAIYPAKDNSLHSPELVHQFRRVFRLQSGDKVIFFNGSGDDYESEIVSMTKEVIEFRIIETRSVKRQSEKRIALAVSLIKKDNFEWIVQKGTELGVSEFIPLVSDRSEKKGFNMERARKIMIEACEQSGRGDVPVVREPLSFKDFISNEVRDIVAFHTEGANFSLESISAIKDIVACVGPEGGWTEDEVVAFKEKGASVARLGAPVLRAETAAVAIATLLLLL